MNRNGFSGRWLALAGLACLSPLFSHQARAMDAFEIQVYEAEVNPPGKAGLEIHYNTVLDGRTQPNYPGEIVPNGLTHLTFEPSYGITPWWEIGGYFQLALAPGWQLYYGGFKVRSKFIVPREKSGDYELGLNVEIGRVPFAFEPDGWASEFRPILGWEPGPWLFDFNPIFGWDFTGGSIAPDLEPAFKIRYDTRRGFGIGIEYYTTLGRLDQIPGVAAQEHVLFLAGDLLGSPTEFNVGIGHGLTAASNNWTLKMIVGRTF